MPSLTDIYFFSVFIFHKLDWIEVGGIPQRNLDIAYAGLLTSFFEEMLEE